MLISIYLSIYLSKNWREKCSYLFWLTIAATLLQQQYTGYTQKTIHHSFHSLQKSFYVYKRKQHQFPVVKRPILSSSSKPRGCYSDSHHAQFLSGEIIPSKQKSYGLMSVLWFTICPFSKALQSWHRLQKVSTKLKESLSKGVVSRGFNCCYHAPFTMIIVWFSK